MIRVRGIEVMLSLLLIETIAHAGFLRRNYAICYIIDEVLLSGPLEILEFSK